MGIREDAGPFENDTAADFARALDAAPEGAREGMLRAALLRAVPAEESTAAAALVAVQVPGCSPIASARAPQRPVPPLPADLRPLALRALERVTVEPGEDSYWRERSLGYLRRVLAPPARPVAESWARIDAWTAAHAPASYALLAPPADPAEVEAAQAAMGLRFPADLVESLACHDGLTRWANLLPGQPPMSAACILDHWRMCVEIAGDDEDLCEPHEEHGEPWWHPLWIPWAQSDGDAQVIDMREGPGRGRLGRAQHDDSGYFGDGWPSLAAYLQEVADSLDHGGEVDGDVPYLTHDRELWWSFPGETELNGDPLVPAPRA